MHKRLLEANVTEGFTPYFRGQFMKMVRVPSRAVNGDQERLHTEDTHEVSL